MEKIQPTTEKSIGKWISLLHRQFQIYVNKALKPYNINSSEYIYIMYLSEEKNINQKQLSEQIIVDDAATTRALKRLEEKGYVSRERNSQDKRIYNVRLTPQGAKVKPLVEEKLNAWTSLLSQDMDELEIDKMISRLKLMSEYAVRYTKGEKNE